MQVYPCVHSNENSEPLRRNNYKLSPCHNTQHLHNTLSPALACQHNDRRSDMVFPLPERPLLRGFKSWGRDCCSGSRRFTDRRTGGHDMQKPACESRAKMHPRAPTCLRRTPSPRVTQLAQGRPWRAVQIPPLPLLPRLAQNNHKMSQGQN